jgi:hypothetical protein
MKNAEKPAVFSAKMENRNVYSFTGREGLGYGTPVVELLQRKSPVSKVMNVTQSRPCPRCKFASMATLGSSKFSIF